MKKFIYFIVFVSTIGCQHRAIIKSQFIEPSVKEAPFVPVEWPQPVTQDYSVVKGDCLWAIAAKPQIYHDSFAWPLIYKANRDQIKNPDLIEVGQKLVIENYVPQPDWNKAIKTASDYKE